MGHKGNKASLTVVLVWLALTLRHLSLTFCHPNKILYGIFCAKAKFQHYIVDITQITNKLYFQITRPLKTFLNNLLPAVSLAPSF